tara:strand:- start:14 stop:598 length:585 start_codon:yes stop_codon:yes gene_type:complete
MRIFLTVFFLIFSFQSLIKADDIRDFEIEGMTIGDSLLDFFNKNQIDNFLNYDEGTDLKFRISEFYETNNFKISNYDVMQVYHKPYDKNYIISGIRGALFCKNKNKCINQHNKIIDDLKNSFSDFKNSSSEKFKHPDDKTGKSIVKLLFLNLNNGYITVRYTDWSDKMDFSDNVDVEIGTTEVEKWLRSNYGNN